MEAPYKRGRSSDRVKTKHGPRSTKSGRAGTSVSEFLAPASGRPDVTQPERTNQPKQTVSECDSEYPNTEQRAARHPDQVFHAQHLQRFTRMERKRVPRRSRRSNRASAAFAMRRSAGHVTYGGRWPRRVRPSGVD